MLTSVVFACCQTLPLCEGAGPQTSNNVQCKCKLIIVLAI